MPDPPPLLNPLEAVKRELGTQSNRLDTKVKEAVEVAIARCGYTATVGQVGAYVHIRVAVSPCSSARNTTVRATNQRTPHSHWTRVCLLCVTPPPPPPSPPLHHRLRSLLLLA